MNSVDPSVRHEFVYLFDVVNGNPNGDPDAGNLPRVDPETMHGIVTDVAIKRKVRDFIAQTKSGEGGAEIFIQSEVSLNRLITDAFRTVGDQPASIQLDDDEDDELLDWFASIQSETFEVDDTTLTYRGESTKEADMRSALRDAIGSEVDSALKTRLLALPKRLASAAKSVSKNERAVFRRDARAEMCRRYYDIRMFGAVLQTGPDAGQVRGPMQLTFARSIDPVTVIDMAMTRKARTTAQRMETGSTEFARKPYIPYGLYRVHGYFNPYFADDTGASQPDLEWFWEALEKMLWIDQSAARAEMTARRLYVFSHDSKLGKAPAHKLLNKIQVTLKDGVSTPRCFEDYIVTADIADLPEGVSHQSFID